MIIVHSDDYGINESESNRILACRENGALNSVSILANGHELSKSLDKLDDAILKAIHFNLVEGKCCANPAKIPLLVDSEGYFKRSFFQLLCLSVIRGKSVRKQSTAECLAQIERVCALLGDGYAIRIDSHMHYHMIPAIFRGMLDACAETGRPLEYIRMPLEPVSPFWKHRKVWRHIPLVNLIKTLVLHTLGSIDKRILKKRGIRCKEAVFFGVNFTGRMTEKEVLAVLPEFERIANQRGADLEILFHPGAVLETEEYPDGRQKDKKAFYQSPFRELEAKTIRKLGELL